MEQHTSQIEVKPLDKKKIKKFLRVMWYLAIITIIEFGIAFTVPHEQKWLRIVVFIALTIVKAYYIVSEFMHLGHEKKSLKMSIVLPMILVVFFIFIMIYQGGAILQVLSQTIE